MKFTNLGFPAVERRLAACDDTVQRAFQILHAAILYMDARIQIKEYAQGGKLGLSRQQVDSATADWIAPGSIMITTSRWHRLSG